MSAMNRFCDRGIHLPLMLAIIITLFPYEGGTLSRQAGSSFIKINILSKHLRLMKDGAGSELNFTFPKGTVIRHDDSEFYSGSLKISHQGETCNISAGNRSLSFRRCLIYSNTPGALCGVRIKGEERYYPLPLEIIREKETVKIFITETPGQYASDSASAELGYLKPECTEALYALALAIHGRCGIDSLRRKHGDCDFCDLTCCQTYRGRSGLLPVEGPFIDTAGQNCGLFFHSSSGGRLFSESVFNSGGRKSRPPADILYSENLMLSRGMHSPWEAEIEKSRISGLIYPDRKFLINEIRYDPEKEMIIIHGDTGTASIAPEDFRLRINRRKGWNFIKSNNYTLSSDSAKYIFRGAGLGHCTGMSLEGAVQLAGKGYSRYEILEHYYPDLKYIQRGNVHTSFQYVTYNTDSGEVILSSSGPALLERRVPCGSLFKLFTVIYLATERRDIFFNHHYLCEKENPLPLPLQCWERRGHGDMNISSAIYNSCNVYFSSLHDRIDRKDFTRWFNEFVRSQNISMRLPEIKTEAEWSALLAGLDFRTDISVRDLITLSLFIDDADRRLPRDAAGIITGALRKTFTSGTAKITEKDIASNIGLKIIPPDMWGKTGTVIAGTNSHHSYGLFTGGCGGTGIVTIFRKGRGVDAAHLSVSLLKKKDSLSCSFR